MTNKAMTVKCRMLGVDLEVDLLPLGVGDVQMICLLTI